jgi:HlyD family secretion protein
VLLAGMYASARLVLAQADEALIVPREAVVARDGQRMVLKVNGDTVAPVAVVEGLSDGRVVQIVSGLAAGDQVLADARRQLPADARVNPVLR